MAIESIGRVSQTEVAGAQATVGLDDFLQIFLTQLNFQDPLEPVDNREFLAQLAQFSSIELANRSNENTEALLDVSSLSQSIGLLGKQVNAQIESGFLTGTVTAMRLVGGQPQLSITNSDGNVSFISPTAVTSVIELTEEL